MKAISSIVRVIVYSVLILGILLIALVLFWGGIQTIRTGHWSNTITFANQLDLKLIGAKEMQLPFSHHNSRSGGGDFFVFEWQGKLLASEKPIIESQERFWLFKRKYQFQDEQTKRTIYLLNPYNLFLYFLGRLGALFILSLLWAGFVGWILFGLLKYPEPPSDKTPSLNLKA
jgi:hypothetical protein